MVHVYHFMHFIGKTVISPNFLNISIFSRDDPEHIQVCQSH